LLGALCTPLPAGAKDKGKKDKEAEVVAPPPTAPPGHLAPDSVVKLIVIGNYKSGNAKKGERVNLRVDDDVLDSAGTALIRKGTPAYGTVANSRGSGLFGKRGLLDISIDYTTGIDGTKVPLRANKSRAGKSAAGATIATAILFAPVALFIKGGNVTLKEGTEIVAYVDDTVKIGAATDSGASAPASTAPSGPKRILSLRNGDTVTGHVQGLTDGVYTVVTANGTLKIKADDVKEIKDAEAAK
jgi:hypothetical protein